MADLQPKCPDYVARVHDSFKRQAFMGYLNARLGEVAPGAVDIELDHRAELCQQHGFFHGGVVGTLADVSGGYASFSLMGENDSVLTVEYKLNLMAPAQGEKLIARGRVIRAGRQLIVSRSDVFAVAAGVEKPCAALLGTFMVMTNFPEDTREPQNG